jgi:lipoate-protein ligase A
MYDVTLRSAEGDPFLNLALEESLLERGFGLDSALLLYVNEACVVVGRNQNPWVEVSSDSCLPVLRRVSGGGAVYHDKGNLNWALIVPRARHDREAELALIADALRGLGVRTRIGPRGGLFYAGGGPWEGAKLSGTARRISATRVLHHGTLLVDADLDRLISCLRGIEVDSSRALCSVPSASVNLSTLVPGLGVEEVALALARALTGREPEEASSLEDGDFARSAAIRLASWDWIWGSTPPFSVGLSWNGGRASLEVKGGIVHSVSGDGSETIARLVGRKFSYETRGIAVKALERGEPPCE